MLLELLIGLACILGICYWLLNRKWTTYWAEQGVKTPPTSFPFGSSAIFNWHLFLNTKNAIDVAREQYKTYKNEKIYGTFMFGEPQLVITDAEVMKQIMVKDFNKFVERNSPRTMELFFSGKSTSDIVWMKQLVFLGGEEWKDVRSTFSPIFTSGKMKSMMMFINHVSDHLMTAVDEKVAKGEEIELKEYFGKFTMDSIASCAFGVEACSFTDPNSSFVKNARSIFRTTLLEGIKIAMAIIPGPSHLIKALGIPIFKPTETMFFYHMIRNTVKHRLETKTRRNDLIDMMIDCLREDDITENTKEEDEDQFDLNSKLAHTRKTTNLTGEKKELDEMAIISTALIILVAGYDTTGQTLSYAGYQLAKNPDIQKRLHDDIDQAIEDAGGKMPDYTVIQGMEYLDQLLHETLRMYPALGMITRACSEDVVLKTPGCTPESVKLEKGTEIHLNVAGLHCDPEHYPNPERFDPERFSKENKAKRHPNAYLGFGSGPRSCFGMRFALLEAKVALVSMLAKYSFVRSERTPEKTDFDPASTLGACKQPLYIRLEKR